jgi:photosystem II stability/assembly factor-like uncharacterized protein
MNQTSGTTNALHAVSSWGQNLAVAVGFDGRILRSQDGGLSWTNQTVGQSNSLYSVPFVIGLSGTSVGYLGVIVHTTDGGMTWTPQASGTGYDLNDAFFSDPATGTAVGGHGTIVRTTNGGESWIEQTSGTLNKLQGVWFTDSEHGVAVGFSGTVLRTTNGGSVWNKMMTGTRSHLFDFCFTDDQIGFTVGNDGTILRTSNGGISWNSQVSGTTQTLFGVSFADENDGTVVGESGIILHTQDGGASWLPQVSGTNEDLISVTCIDPNNRVAVGYNAVVVRTTDGGGSWAYQETGTRNPLFGVTFVDAATGWTVGDRGIILHTATGGTGIPPPDAPELMMPSDSSTTGLEPVLHWGETIGSFWYTVEVSTHPYFVTSILNQSNITSSTFALGGLVDGQRYYWRVSMTDESGTSRWSDVWSFIASSSFSSVPCDSIDQFLARCVFGGTIQARVILLNSTQYDGEEVVVRVDGENHAGTIVTNGIHSRASILAGGQASGEHTVELVSPSGCFPPQLVTCSADLENPSGDGGAGKTLHMGRSLPGSGDILENYPNPFNPSTTIAFGVPEETRVTLRVYDMLGRLVTTLIDEIVPAGYHSVTWEGRNEDGKIVAGGVYMYRLTAGGFSSVRKMLLAK